MKLLHLLARLRLLWACALALLLGAGLIALAGTARRGQRAAN